MSPCTVFDLAPHKLHSLFKCRICLFIEDVQNISALPAPLFHGNLRYFTDAFHMCPCLEIFLLLYCHPADRHSARPQQPEQSTRAGSFYKRALSVSGIIRICRNPRLVKQLHIRPADDHLGHFRITLDHGLQRLVCKSCIRICHGHGKKICVRL